MKIAVIIPAAGAGRRFAASDPQASGGAPKTEIDLAGKPVLLRSIDLFLDRQEVGQLIVAVDPEKIDRFRLRWGDKMAFHGVRIVPGGKTERWQTVRNALDAVEADCTHVAVHDAVRPLASDRLISRLFAAGRQHPAVIPGVPVVSTLKRVRDGQPAAAVVDDPLDAILGSGGKEEPVDLQEVVESVSRDGLVEVQTPQLFEIGLFRRAYTQLGGGSVDPAKLTDDAGLIEALGERVCVVAGEPTNIKITRKQDVELAAAVLSVRGSAQSATLGPKRLFSGDDDD